MQRSLGRKPCSALATALALAGLVLAAPGCGPKVDGGTDEDGGDEAPPQCEADTDADCDEVDPAPGAAGGLCLAPEGTCEGDGLQCNSEENYCFDPRAPCLGFHCGGPDAGTCVPTDGAPRCECAQGYDNESFALYCCPQDGSDPVCV